MLKSFTKKSLAVAVMLLASTGVFAQTQITDEAGLKAVANDLSGSYVLAADIQLSGEWTPIGNGGDRFTGTFDGQGHTIKGLAIHNAGTAYQGLFGATEGATIKRVHIVGAHVEGNEHVGILVGDARATLIEQCYVAGFISGRDHAGAFVGDATGDFEGGQITTIKNCLSLAYVEGRQYWPALVAGIATSAIFENNFTLGTAEANDGWSGASAVCALMDGGAAAIRGNASAAYALRGYIAQDDNSHMHAILGNINGCPVDFGTNLTSTATIMFSKGDNAVMAHDDARLRPDQQGQETSPEDLQKAATYTALGWGSEWSLADGRYPVLAGMSVPVEGDFIHFTADIAAEGFTGSSVSFAAVSPLGREVKAVSSNEAVAKIDGQTISFLAEGEVTITFTTEGDNYAKGAEVVRTVTVKNMDTSIASAADFDKIRQNPAGKFYLTADVDMAGTEFTPIADLTGELDGRGHVVRNLSYNNGNTDNVGLFATIHDATIKDLGIEDANLVGNANTAAIVGRAYGGVIERCYVSNSYLEGRDHVGAFAGDVNHNGNGGAVMRNCVSDSRIATRSYQAGGMAGVINAGTIENCFFSGTVDGPGTNVTGIVSLLDSDNEPSVIKNNVAAAAHLNGTNGCPRLINLAGRNINTLENNYIVVTGLINKAPIAAGGDANSDQGATITAADARDKMFYESLGWDFNETWKFFDGADGKSYPILKWMQAPLKTRIFNMPENVALLYTDGSENIDCKTILGSWGQELSFSLTEGDGLATYIEEENRIYVGDEDGYYAGSGDVTAKVSVASALQSYYTIEGDDAFSFFVGESGVTTKIADADDFLKIGRNLQGNYELTADIDMSGVEFEGFANSGSPFTGTLDGAGHKVSGISVSFGDGQDQGVFGQTTGATIKNIAFDQLSVTGQPYGSNHVGFIGSASNTTIDQVVVSGTVKGCDHVGLLAGDADGVTVTNSYVEGTVEAYSQVGGFFGCTLEGGADIQYSYSNATVSATTRGWAGGFVGLIDKSGSSVTIKHCVSIGDVHSTGDGSPHVAAPFIAGNGAGSDPNATIEFEDNVYNSAAVMEGDTDWPGNHETVEGGTVVAATSANPNTLQTKATYTALGWDFDAIWGINPDGDYKYPVLQLFPEIVTGVNVVEGQIIGFQNGVITAAGSEIIVRNAAGQTIGRSQSQARLTGKGLYLVTVKTNGQVKTFKVVNK